MDATLEPAPADTAGRQYSHAERLRVVLGILTCILLAALDQTVVLPAIPQMAASLHGVGHLSWVVSAYLLTSTATTPIYGKLSDQLGRRAVLVPALLFFLAACMVCALAQSVPMLILGRALQGVGGGALLAVSQAAVADVIPPRERGRYQAWFAGTWAFASIAGPIAGGLITQHFSWRWIFWGNLPVGGVALVLCVRGLRGLAPAGAGGKIDYAGAGLLIISVAAILLALSTGGVDFAWISAPEGGIFTAGIIAFAMLFAQQKRAPSPLFPGSLMSRLVFRNILVISFCNAAALFGGIFLLPLLLQWLYHASPAASGLCIMPFLATTTLGAFAAGQVVRHSGRFKPIIAAGVAFSGAGFVVQALLPTVGSLVWPVIISSVAGLGIGAVMPTSIIAAQSQAGRSELGTATGTLLLTRAMGGAFGATMAGALLALAHGNLPLGFRLSFFACAALQAISTCTALRMENVLLRATAEPEKT
jgi:EmrB/QacA subfamily drug resistance transporter